MSVRELSVGATETELKEVELKARIPKDLMDRVKAFQHEHQLDKRKQAVVMLLNLGLNSNLTSVSKKEENHEQGSQ